MGATDAEKPSNQDRQRFCDSGFGPPTVMGLLRFSELRHHILAQVFMGPTVGVAALFTAAGEGLAQAPPDGSLFDVRAALISYMLTPRNQVAAAIGPDGSVWTWEITRNAVLADNEAGSYRAVTRLRLDIVQSDLADTVPIPGLGWGILSGADWGTVPYEWVTIEAIIEESYLLSELPVPHLATATIYMSPSAVGETAYATFEQITPFATPASVGDVWIQAGHWFADEARTTAIADEIVVWMMQSAIGTLGYLCRYTFRGQPDVELTLESLLRMVATNATCLLIDRSGSIYGEIVRMRLVEHSDNPVESIVTWHIPWRALPLNTQQNPRPPPVAIVAPPADFLFPPPGRTAPEQPAGGISDDLPSPRDTIESPQRPEGGGVLNLLGGGNNGRGVDD